MRLSNECNKFKIFPIMLFRVVTIMDCPNVCPPETDPNDCPHVCGIHKTPCENGIAIITLVEFIRGIGFVFLKHPRVRCVFSVIMKRREKDRTPFYFFASAQACKKFEHLQLLMLTIFPFIEDQRRKVDAYREGQATRMQKTAVLVVDKERDQIDGFQMFDTFGDGEVTGTKWEEKNITVSGHSAY